MGRGSILFSIILACILCLNSCSPSREEATLRIVIPSRIQTTDPHHTPDTATLGVLSNVYEPLVAFGGDTRVTPVLATSWSNPDENTWQFVLREDVYFHDGSLLTAEDVHFTLKSILDDPSSMIRAWIKTVRDVRVLDDSTVELHTSRPSPLLLPGLAYVGIISKNSDFSVPNAAYGTGPYRFGRMEESNGFELERSDRYWKGLPEWEYARFDHNADGASRLHGVLDQRADLATADESMVLAIEGENIHVVEYPGAKVAFLGFSLKKTADNIFVDPKIRQAIALSIDQRQLIEQVLGGLAQPTGQLLPFQAFGYNPETPPLQPDLQKARELVSDYSRLMEKEYPFYCVSNSRTIADFIQKEVANIGIRFDVRELSSEKMDSLLFQQEAEAYVLQFTFPTMDASDMLMDGFHTRSEFSGMGIMNFSGYSSNELDRLLEESDVEMDPEKRYRMLVEAMKTVLDTNIWIPLCVRSNLFVAGKRVRWSGNSTGRILLQEIRKSM